MSFLSALDNFMADLRFGKKLNATPQRGHITGPILKRVRCPNCDGSGTDPLEPEHGCNQCNGTGRSPTEGKT